MLRLNVGTNRKIGQPDYGSAGASCNLELELDTTLFQDLDGLQQVVRRAYAACNQAVNDELARLTHHGQHQHPHHEVSQPGISPEPVVEVRTSPMNPGARVTASIPARTTAPARTTTTTETHPSPRPATASQVRFIRAICNRRKIDLVGLLREKFGIHTADELGIRQASDQFGSTETRASLDALAARMLTAFLASPAASVQGRVLGVEEEIRGMLVEGVPDLYGRVALLTEDSDSLVITDIKTSRGKWSPEQVEDSGEQLLLYSKLASEISPGKKIVTRFLVLTKTKEPVIEEHVREVEPGNLKRSLVSVERVWRAIESGVFYPAPSVMSCSSCGYREACRAWMG